MTFKEERERQFEVLWETVKALEQRVTELREALWSHNARMGFIEENIRRLAEHIDSMERER